MIDRILYQPWGGLGDNLQYTTLPELYSKNGDKFYISKENAYRNPEIYELVWGLNPYVDGVSDKPYNIGSCKQYSRLNFEKSIVYNQEIKHGFEPENETPKIYYQPKNIKEFNDKIFIDISSISSQPIMPDCDLRDLLNDTFSNFFEIEQKIKKSKIIIPLFKKHISKDHKINSNILYDDAIEVESLFHYCDMINSCEYFICSFSGQSVLASALNKEKTLCLIPNHHRNSDFCFPNIKYYHI